MNLILFLLSAFLYVLTFKTSGEVISYARQFLIIMLSYNISLAVFNLVPVPPLDGYRLVNQIFFHGSLDRQLTPQMMQMIRFTFLFVCMSGVLSSAFSRVCSFCMNGVASLFFRMLY